MQRRDFFERLHHRDKKIKVETNHGANDVDPAPRPREMFRVTREDRNCEKRQRYDAETNGRRKTMKREKESRDRRSDGCDKKPFRAAIETFAGEHSEHNDEAGENCNEANQRVNDGVDLQDHSLPITSIFARDVTSRFVAIARLQLALLRLAAIVSQSFAKRLYGCADNNGQFDGTIRRTALGTASYRTLENCTGSPSRLTGIASSVRTSAQGVCQ